MPTNKTHFIVVSVTDIIHESGLKQFLSSNFSYIKPDVKNHSSFEKLNTISVSLTGDIIENIIRINFSLTSENLQNEIFDSINTAKEKYRKLYDAVIAEYYQELEEKGSTFDKWIVYSEDDYDLVIDSLEINTIGILFFNRSIVKKVRQHGDAMLIEEKGYTLISAKDYYGSIISKLDYFELLYRRFLLSHNSTIFEETEALKCLVLFTQVTIRAQWLQISNNKKNIGTYAVEDLFKINDLIKSIPHIDYYGGAIYHPKLHIEFEKGIFEGRVLATPDFISQNKILEVKASSSISKLDFYQILIYYALAKHEQNIEYYGDDVMLCEIVYVKRKIRIQYDFYKTISKAKLKTLQNEIIKSAIRHYKKSSIYIRTNQ